MVGIEYAAIPLSHVCSEFYPFIESWVRNFFTREIINNPNLFRFIDHDGKEITATMIDPELQFSEKNVRKMINNYCLNMDDRFSLIEVLVRRPNAGKDAKPIIARMKLKGKEILRNGSSRILERPMTITDILFIAAVDVCKNRHTMVSRYPVGTDKGMYFAKINVQSTANHIHLILNEKEYRWYPDIDLNTNPDYVGIKFIDTLVTSNSHLDGMGADFDGDTESERGIYSDEANAESEKIMNQKTSALTISGTNSKVVSKEVLTALYELTKDPGNGKMINEMLTKEYLSYTPKDITLSKLADLFATMPNGPSGKDVCRHETYDKIKVPADHFFAGQKPMTTTIGRFVLNLFIMQGANIIETTGYVDSVINKKALGALDNEIGYLYKEDAIDRQQFNQYTDRRDTLGYWLAGMLSPTISEKFMKPLPEITKRKAELCEKYKDQIAAGDIDIMTQISDELVAYAKELLKDDPGMEQYLSGELDFGVNYKNNSIIKGAVMNKLTDEFDFIDTSLMDGINVKDIPAHANSILASQYPASIATQGAGYTGKKLIALLQMMQVDDSVLDCGTKRGIPIKITKLNKDDMIDSYIIEGDQIHLLDRHNIDSYIGKTVIMRSPMTCINKKICHHCAGNLFKSLGIVNAGLFGTQISHSALNLGLKAKHVSVVNLHKFNVDDLLVDV